jgi:hypothetical protein
MYFKIGLDGNIIEYNYSLIDILKQDYFSEDFYNNITQQYSYINIENSIQLNDKIGIMSTFHNENSQTEMIFFKIDTLNNKFNYENITTLLASGSLFNDFSIENDKLHLTTYKYNPPTNSKYDISFSLSLDNGLIKTKSFWENIYLKNEVIENISPLPCCSPPQNYKELNITENKYYTYKLDFNDYDTEFGFKVKLSYFDTYDNLIVYFPSFDVDIDAYNKDYTKWFSNYNSNNILPDNSVLTGKFSYLNITKDFISTFNSNDEYVYIDIDFCCIDMNSILYPYLIFKPLSVSDNLLIQNMLAFREKEKIVSINLNTYILNQNLSNFLYGYMFLDMPYLTAQFKDNFVNLTLSMPQQNFNYGE